MRIDPVAQQLFDLRRDGLEQRFGFPGGCAAGAQVNLDIARAGKDGGDGIRDPGVHWRDQRVQIRFAHPGDAIVARADHLRRKELLQARDAFVDEQRLQLAGRAGQQHDHARAEIDPLPRRGAARIGQRLCAFDQVRLAAIDVRHPAVDLAEALLDPAEISSLKISPRPSAAATASRVRSSSVGPRPP